MIDLPMLLQERRDVNVSRALDYEPRAEIAHAWRVHLFVLSAIGAVLGLVFRDDIADMVLIWWNSPTFNHCMLILPIIAWLIWQRRDELGQLRPSTWPPGLAIVVIGAMAWLVGEGGGIALGRHFGIVVMLQGSVVAILGLSVTRGLLFPLSYALFLVPFGEELVPYLQSVTADLSMVLLGLFGVPAHIEGVFITTPFGYFEVAEACSGVKFLIAMTALGALAANLCFKTWPKRAAFMAVCLVVPIVANGIRAFGTIYLASIYGIEFAENADHVIYGWFFFAFVIVAVLAIGWAFFDRELDDPAFNPSYLRDGSTSESGTVRAASIAGIAFVIGFAPVLWLASNSLAARNGEIPILQLPVIHGWEHTDAAMRYPWQAIYANADRIETARYRNADDQIVDLTIGYYASQDEGRELVGFGQGGLPPETEWSWIENSPSPRWARAYRIMAPGPVSRDVFEYNWIGGSPVQGRARAKLETLRARLFGDDQSAIGITVSAEGRDARAALERFITDSGEIETLVDQSVGLAD